ncbi:MAG: hypothetical protein VX976_01435 [Pseudomonadota bacterium]|nr:hypothetical protein [Pseudomonadota bacterium]
MINFLLLIFFSFNSYFTLLANENVLSESLLNDEDYYKTGVNFYDQGDFKKSFIVFFNLSEKGNIDAIYNISNMYFEGIGTVQDYSKSLKYTWLCSLNGNKRCLKKIDTLMKKLDEEESIKISKKIPEILENNYVNKNDPIAAFQLGYWYEKISPEIDFEKSYLWYSVSVSAGIYKAMKMRDRVGEEIEKKNILAIQQQANEIYTKNKYFKKENKKE